MMTMDLDGLKLEAHLRMPQNADRVAIFVHGSGSSWHSPRNNFVAERLEQDGIASLLFDLLTEAEDASRETRFDIDLLTRRVEAVVEWTKSRSELSGLARHLFGASTGAAAAVRAAVGLGDREGAAADELRVRTIVSRGGRPDLAGDALGRLQVPCLLIVGGNDPEVLSMNRDARARMTCESELRVVEGATHLFQEPGALDEVARLACDWILRS